MASPLADLIHAHCERTGDTLADIAARGSLSRQTLSALVNRTDANQMPRASTIRKLADGLGLSYELVASVAQQTAYGETPHQVSHRREVEVLIEYADKLPDEDVRVLLAAARALGVRHDPTPSNDPPKATRAKTKARKASANGLSVVS